MRLEQSAEDYIVIPKMWDESGSFQTVLSGFVDVSKICNLRSQIAGQSGYKSQFSPRFQYTLDVNLFNSINIVEYTFKWKLKHH